MKSLGGVSDYLCALFLCPIALAVLRNCHENNLHLWSFYVALRQHEPNGGTEEYVAK
ncbi:hypothetical protein VNVC001_33590 [Vibrio cholerae]|nr:predicted protein [Vibrio cholerae RC385]BER97038.1 hypothetical protein VNVC001_33590 [Vibrio cholerae]